MMVFHEIPELNSAMAATDIGLSKKYKIPN